jgi:hypothetical protein
MLLGQVLLLFVVGLPCSPLGAAVGYEAPLVVSLGEAADGTLSAVQLSACVKVSDDDPDQDAKVECIVVRAHPGGDTGDVQIQVLPGGAFLYSDDDASKGLVVVQASAGGDEGDPSGAAMLSRVILKRLGGEVQPGGPWLGIQFGPVPKPLAAHLDLDGEVGQMVLNVIEGSPAEDAGLEQYDVILKVDGREVPSKIESFLDMVRDLTPGETYAFTILSGGRETQVSLTAGQRPEDTGPAKFKYTYETDLEELAHGRTFRRGGLLEKDDDGNWSFKRFGLEDMPDVWKFFPHEEDFEFNFEFDFDFPDTHHQFIWEEGKGRKLRIERSDDGQITVTRTETEDEDTTTTTNTYANEEELEQEDPEAYEMMKKGGGCRIGIFGGKGKTWFGGHGFLQHLPEGLDIDIDIDEILEGTKEIRKHAAELRERLQKQLGAQEHGTLQEFFLHRKPRTSFEILSDGKVRVTQRRGDEASVETFDSTADLRAKRPDLYEKFQKLHGDRATKKLKRM